MVDGERRIVQNRTFDETQWVKYASSLASRLTFMKDWPGEELTAEVLPGVAGHIFLSFHQDINSPQAAMCTAFDGKKLWLFRTPGSTDAESPCRTSHNMSDIKGICKHRTGRPRFYVGVKENRESVYQPHG